MREIINQWRGVSCTISGELIPLGAKAYAESEDHLRNGMGICQAEYKNMQKAPAKKAPAPKTDKQKPEDDPKE